MTNDLHSGQLACLEDGVMTGMIGIKGTKDIMGRGRGDATKNIDLCASLVVNGLLVVLLI